MQGAPASMKKRSFSVIRPFSASKSPSSSRPENQPPQTEMPYFERMGPSVSMFIGNRRPVSMPVKPASEACRRHSSRLTSSLSSSRSSFHHAIGAMPSCAFIALHSHALVGTDLVVSLAGLAHGLEVRDLRYTNIPVGVARHPGPGVGHDGKHRGPVIPLRPGHGRLEIGEAFAMTHLGAHGLGMLGKIDMQRILAILDPAVRQQVVETGHALELLETVDHGVATIVTDDDDHLVAG